MRIGEDIADAGEAFEVAEVIGEGLVGIVLEVGLDFFEEFGKRDVEEVGVVFAECGFAEQEFELVALGEFLHAHDTVGVDFNALGVERGGTAGACGELGVGVETE